MNPAPKPEEKTPAIEPTEVWSPSMGTEVMPVAGEIAVSSSGLAGGPRCNYCGHCGCPWEPYYRDYPERDSYGGQEYRYVGIDEMTDVARYDPREERERRIATLLTAVAAIDEMSRERFKELFLGNWEPAPARRIRLFTRPMLSSCAHSRKRYHPGDGWKCMACGEKVR